MKLHAFACTCLVLLVPLLVVACASSRGGGAQRARHPRLDEPRIPPVREGNWTEAQRAYLEPKAQAGMLFNLFTTAANHPHLAESVEALAFGHVGNPEASTLPARDRELLILRTAWMCDCEYQWAQHARIARKLGLTEEELERILAGPDAAGWTPHEAALLRAADELHADQFVGDATWRALAATYDRPQLMDTVVTVGTYTLASMSINSWGVQLDEGLSGFPDGASTR